jgi:Ca-activated chloride channel family protein
MRFNQPAWLAIGLVACLLLLWLWRRYDARQSAALERFVSAHLRTQLTRSISVGKRRLQRGLYLLSLALLFVALAEPTYGFRWEEISRRGNDIVFALDTSRSMLTPDTKPNRLTRAKLAIDDFVERLDGDAVGLLAFAGSAFMVCPITLDYGAFHESLAATDTDTIPRGGTDISSAIHEAEVALQRRPASDKILILLTDGEDLEGDSLAAARAAAQQGLKIYTVGVGTPAGDLIPIPPHEGGGFVKDDSGAFVRSKLDEAALSAIAAATGGFYVPLGTQGEGLQTIFNRALGPLAKHDLASRRQKIYTERYQWPLAASFATLLLSLLIGNRKRRGRGQSASSVSASSAAASSLPASRTSRSQVSAASFFLASWVAAGLALSMLAGPVHAATPTDTAQSDTAAAAASPPTSPGSTSGVSPAIASQPDAKKPVIAYNTGTAAYRAGQFSQAERAFQQAITAAPSSDPKRLADQEDAYYDLGNTLYRAGQKTEQSAPQDTIKQWEQAVKAYDTALQLRPDDADSKYNRDLVKRKIEALKQQKPPPQKQNDKGQGKGQGQGQGNGQGQGQSQPQDKGQGQPPPQGQPQSSPQDAKNNDPKQPPQQGQGQQPPQGQGQQPPQQGQGQQPPPQQNSGQPPQQGQGQQAPQQPTPPGQQSGGSPKDQPPPTPPAKGQPQRADQSGDPDQSADDAAREADNEHAPGQMSREEARELLDSVKGDERHALGAPLAQQQDPDDRPDKPFKNW